MTATAKEIVKAFETHTKYSKAHVSVVPYVDKETGFYCTELFFKGHLMATYEENKWVAGCLTVHMLPTDSHKSFDSILLELSYAFNCDYTMHSDKNVLRLLGAGGLRAVVNAYCVLTFVAKPISRYGITDGYFGFRLVTLHNPTITALT